MTSKLTIGCPTFRDFGRTLFTLRSLQMHGHLPRPGEIISRPDPTVVDLLCVDNDPDGPHSRRLREECEASDIRYVTHNVQGSCPAKNAVFANARGEWVLCIDSHVLFPPGLIDRILAYVETLPAGNRDLIHAPLWNSNLWDGSLMTCHVPKWSGAMWGVWEDLPQLRPNNPANTGEPIEVWGNGCWFLLMRRDAWPGFHPGCEGFGGEEGAIQAIVRSRGGKVLTHPNFVGWHSFEPPSNTHDKRDQPYRNINEDKFVNYALNLRRAGVPLDEMLDYFSGRTSGEMNFATDKLRGLLKVAEDREKALAAPAAAPCGSCGAAVTHPVIVSQAVPAQIGTPCGKKTVAMARTQLEAMYVGALRVAPPEMAALMPWLRSLCAGKDVLEVSQTRTVLGVGLQTEAKKLTVRVHKEQPLLSISVNGQHWDHSVGLEIPEVGYDVAVIYGFETAPTIWPTLAALPKVHPVKIAIVGTGRFSEMLTGPDGKPLANAEGKPIPGLLPALREFLRQNGHYSVVEDLMIGLGYTVISCDQADKPALPSLAKQAWNFAGALASHIASGAKILPQDEVQKRLDICAMCPNRNGNRCSRCGCPLDSVDGKPGRAYWAAMPCPVGKWPLPQIDKPT